MLAPSNVELSLLNFYEREVLPVLFEQLDRAMPEFRWQRRGCGWSGTIPSAASSNGAISNGSSKRIVRDLNATCDSPWGYCDAQGRMVSWLAHVSGGTHGELPEADKLPQAIEKLAQLVGVEALLPSHEEAWKHRRHLTSHARQLEMIEACVAYCRVQLAGVRGERVRAYLEHNRGFAADRIPETSLGVYPSIAAMNDHLATLGFTSEEISQSWVASDPRIEGRLMIPWRDRYGVLKSMVAIDIAPRGGKPSSELYLRRSARPLAFGLDVALRPSSGGCEHLVLVEGLIDVVYLQAHGLMNVAAIGGSGAIPQDTHWRHLADSNVRTATLAVSDDEAGWQRTSQGIVSAHQTVGTPQVLAIRAGELQHSRSPVEFARLRGVEALRRAIDRRMHGYRFHAEHLIRQHKTGPSWTDAGTIAALEAAVEFDAAVNHAERANELDRYFWPTLLESLGGDWSLLERLLGGRVEVLHKRQVATQQARLYARLLRELDAALKKENFGRFEDLILAAAHEIRPEPEAKPDPEIKVLRVEVPVEVPVHIPVQMPAEAPQRAEVIALPEARQIVHAMELPGEMLDSSHPTPTRTRVRPLLRPKLKPAPALKPVELPKAAIKAESKRPVIVPQPALKKQPKLDVGTIAYMLWDKNGRPDGLDRFFWFAAEQAVAEQSGVESAA